MSVASAGQRSGLGSDLNRYDRRNRLRAIAQRFAPDGASIRTCGELAPRRHRRVSLNRKATVDPRLQESAGVVLDVDYAEHLCERSWLCAVCAYVDGCRRRDELTRWFSDWLAAGHSLALLTVDAVHEPGNGLAVAWGQLRAGRSSVLSGDWTRDKSEFGIAAHAWSVEILDTPERSWNPHCHIALLLDEPLDHEQIAVLLGRIGDRFARGVKNADGEAAGHAQDLRMWNGTAHELAGYLTKSHIRIRPMSQRTGASRTHLEVLADLGATGEGHDRWQEVVIASTGQQQVRPSNGIADVIADRVQRTSRRHNLGI